MRENKFRAWDIMTRRWIPNDQVRISADGRVYELIDNDVDVKWDDRTPYIKIVFFTGLKDKNGKEIYEGDIVNIKHPMDKGGDFGDTNGRVFWYVDGWAHGNQSGRPPKAMWEYCEVIGNVYENLELLEV